MEFTRLQLCKYYTAVTAMMGMLLILLHIHESFRKLWSYRMWDNGMDRNAKDKSLYTLQYHVLFLKYVENQ